jgi:anthranilate phosphoribosyltransferase
MTPDVADALKIVAARKPLPRELAERTFLDLMDGKATEAQKGAILLGIATRGGPREIAGPSPPARGCAGPDAALAAAGHLQAGGIGRDLFNISTAAAVVAAGAGAAVAKHGNRSISSRSGRPMSSACGVAIDLARKRAACWTRSGWCFCSRRPSTRR